MDQRQTLDSRIKVLEQFGCQTGSSERIESNSTIRDGDVRFGSP